MICFCGNLRNLRIAKDEFYLAKDVRNQEPVRCIKINSPRPAASAVGSQGTSLTVHDRWFATLCQPTWRTGGGLLVSFWRQREGLIYLIRADNSNGGGVCRRCRD